MYKKIPKLALLAMMCASSFNGIANACTISNIAFNGSPPLEQKIKAEKNTSTNIFDTRDTMTFVSAKSQYSIASGVVISVNMMECNKSRNSGLVDFSLAAMTNLGKSRVKPEIENSEVMFLIPTVNTSSVKGILFEDSQENKGHVSMKIDAPSKEKRITYTLEFDVSQ